MKPINILHKKHYNEMTPNSVAELVVMENQEYIPHYLFPEDQNDSNSFDYSVRRHIKELDPNRNRERVLRRPYDEMAAPYLSEDMEFSSLYGQSGQLDYLEIRQMLLDEYVPRKKLMVLSLIDTAHFYYRRRQCRKLLMDPDIKHKERANLMNEVKNLTCQITTMTKQLSAHTRASVIPSLNTEPWLLAHDRKTINS